ncbi:hypothetical protein Sme01_35800 [Sphaerisporangium melleum]|uniref:Effector-associated domain-containing protein n=1 Tax=Sphaerisporangium melleum TaxID=321316 RepID=A0A917RAF7_9ACTN|nr:effector-associated domain EAD1-containing protein [Sphaerisporangium melleum]GGK97302.1 hypothetical protein GCM10007964_44450 [Sphaerisporangium melleum]GII71104.1 hypothetical protein Sme01_35800 [Sphaerisporangium melleum]
MCAFESRLGPRDEPGGSGGAPEDIRLTPADRADLLSTLARIYNTASRADPILDAIDFPAQRRPPFNDTPEVAWNDIFREIHNGIAPAGYRRLLEHALRVYTSNSALLALQDRYLTVPAEPSRQAGTVHPGHPEQAGRPEPSGQRVHGGQHDQARQAERAQRAEHPGAEQGTRPGAQREPQAGREDRPTCHVIFRADTEEERTAARNLLEAAGLSPAEVWSTPSSVSFRIDTADTVMVRGILDRTDFGWTVVPPGAPDYLFRQIYIEGPDGRRFRISDAPAQQTVGHVAAEVVGAYGPNFPGAKRPTVVDHVNPDGSGRRLDPDGTLHDEGVRDGDELRVGFHAVAAAVHPVVREDALFRVKNQLLDYGAAHPDVRVLGDSPLAPTEYRLEFTQPSFGPPATPGGEPVRISEHVVVIMLGPEFPVVAPKVFWMTPFYHPNVWPNYDGPRMRENRQAAGLVCLGALDESYDASLDFGDLCAMLREIAAYRNYSVWKPDGGVDFYDGEAAAWVESEEGRRRIREIGGTDAHARPQRRGSYVNVIEWLGAGDA